LNRTVRTVVLGLLFLCACPDLVAQNQVPFNQRDDQYRLLGLKRAREAYTMARAEYERQKDLFERDLLTQAALERSRSMYADAEVNYQQSLLAVLFEQQYVSILEAVKYQGEDGRKRVRLKVANMSGGSAEFRQLVEVDDELFRSLQPDVVHNVYVSILNSDGAIISQPYEAKIEELHYGKPKTLDFAMLQDLDAVTVYLIYSNGTERNFKVFLQKDATADQVYVQSEQFSQEVPLGKTASFDLTLELFSGGSDTYSLDVVNLPDQIGRYFTDGSGRARLSQLKFTESSRTKAAALEVTLPDRPTDMVQMDQPITFYALVIPRTQRRELGEIGSRTWTEDEIVALGAGYVRLELVPRGKGELLVRAPLLYHSIEAGDEVRTRIDLYNEGSHRIDQLEFDVELPLGWSRALAPDRMATLDIGEEKPLELTLVPPEEVAEGKYDIRLRITGLSDNQPIASEDKTFTVEVRAGSNIAGTMIILLLLVGVVGGVVVFAIRLSRR
jgi:uncharacterized membrane protein